MRALIDTISTLSFIVVCSAFTLYQVSLLWELYDKETEQEALRYACLHGSRLAQVHGYCAWVRFDQCFIKQTVDATEVEYCEKIKNQVFTVKLRTEAEASTGSEPAEAED